MSTLLSDLLRSSAERYPDKQALVFAKESVSFAELDDRSDKVAAHLSGLGIGVADRVAIVYQENVAAVVFFWGILKAGAVSIDIPTQASPDLFAAILQECVPKALVISPEQGRRLLGESDPEQLPRIMLTDGEFGRPSAQREVHALATILAGAEVASQRPAIENIDVAIVIYTSGSTGRPKGVMLSHQNLISNLEAANTLTEFTSEDSLLLAAPLHFVHGRMQLLAHARLGGTIFFSNGFQFPQSVYKEFITHGVSAFSGVPYHFSALLDRSKLTETPPPMLRNLLITGGALAPAELRRLAEGLPEASLHIAYGQTEAAPRITYLGPDEVLVREGCSGRALPGVTVEILDADGTALPTDEIGEVVVSGPNVMQDYLSGDAVELGVLDDRGRLYTGDLGRLDAEGYLYLAGRMSEMIKSAGERIFPREIVEILDVHPQVEKSAVLGVPDPMLGDRVVALVVPLDGQVLTSAELRSHCLASLPFVRVPKEFRSVEALPMTASGKVDRSQLRSVFEGAE